MNKLSLVPTFTSLLLLVGCGHKSEPGVCFVSEGSEPDTVNFVIDTPYFKEHIAANNLVWNGSEYEGNATMHGDDVHAAVGKDCAVTFGSYVHHWPKRDLSFR